MKKEWCRHPKFESQLTKLLDHANLVEMTIEDRRELILEALRETALFVRNVLFVNDPLSKSNTLLRLSSSSRAVWYNGFKLADTLIQHSELGHSFLSISQGRVVLLDPGS